MFKRFSKFCRYAAIPLVIAVLLSVQTAEARGLLPKARARVANRIDNRVARRAVRRGLAVRRPAVVFRNGVALHRVNRAAVVFAAPHFNRVNFVQLVPTARFSRVQLVAEDPCDTPAVDDVPPLVSASFRRSALFAAY